MHAHDLAQLAAVAAVHSDQLAAARPETMDQMLAAYWRASRCRLDRWCHSLHALSELSNELSRSATLPDVQTIDKPAAKGREPCSPEWSVGAAAVVEEILVSEILTRTIAALTVAHDERHAQAESAPIGRNIFDGHRDARRRALALVASPGHRGTLYAKSIVALHRQCHRWSDLLLAYLATHTKVEQFAASPARVTDFTYDARHHLSSPASSDMAVTMILAGMNSSLKRLSPDRSPNTDLNLELAAAVLGCFSPDDFDSLGLLNSAWFERLRNSPNETSAAIEDWWQMSPIDSPPLGKTRWRR
jgi:hypothetical protein